MIRDLRIQFYAEQMQTISQTSSIMSYKARPQEATFRNYMVNKVLIGDLGIALRLMYGFW